MDLQLKNLRAIVTASSRGLGLATARSLAQEGARVAINGREPSSLEKAANSLRHDTSAEVLAFPGDITDPDLPAAIVEQVAASWGGIDILVTNSGGPKPGPFESFSDEDWLQAFQLSFLSHVRLIRAALPFLKKSQAASVLTVTSYFVKQPIPNMILSNSIRSATIGLTKTLALELGSEGIRFNSILPAWTETERTLSLFANRAKANGTTVEEELQKQARNSAIGRMSTPQEFGNVAAFLVSPIASYLTGVMLSVDGGLFKGIY